MRHLFYIHSCITYIVAISIVSELELDRNDVVLIYGRGFQHHDQENIKIVELSPSVMQLSKVPSYGERFLVFKRFREISEFDKLIDDVACGGGFVAYLPLTKNFLMQLFATHSLCHDVVFLEEGLLTYTGNFNKQTHSRFTRGVQGKIARWIRYPNHGNRSFYYRPYHHSRPLPVYMLHEPLDLLEPDIEVRVLKKIVVPPVDPRFKLDNGYLLVVDTVVEDGVTSLQTYLRILHVFIQKLLRGKSDTLWVRLRPNHFLAQEIVSLFEENSIHLKILPDKVCPESIFYYSKNLTVIGLHSSLLLYAAMFGHQSYSLLRRLFEIDKAAELRYQTYLPIPKTFYDCVTML